MSIQSHEHVACPDCGLLQDLPHPRPGHVIECARCARVLAGIATGRVDVPLACTTTALIFFVPAAVLPLLHVSTFGAQRFGWISTGITEFRTQGFWPLGALVATFALILPVAYLGGLTLVLASLHSGRTGAIAGLSLGRIFRWVRNLKPWMMLEVFLVGAFVAYSRINDVAGVDVETGGWCLMVASFAMLIALTQLDERTVWEALPIPPEGEARPASFIACLACEWIAPRALEGSHCARCEARLHERKPGAVPLTVALTLAGYLLYIPANLLPVLTIVRFGHEDRNTILSGVFELIRNDLWPLAVIVFVASIVLPLMKLFGLTWMIMSVDIRSRALLVPRTRLYRLIDGVGRWSNIDVFMASLLIAVLQFGTLTSVKVGPGLLAFAAVVVITMLATTAFDTRLMWDAAGRNERGPQWQT